jgi:hypothetical protein
MNRSGLASTLLRAGSEERPSSVRVRRAITALGTAAAMGSLTGEAAGTGAGIASGAAGSALAKAGAGTVSVALAAKWMGIGGVAAVVALGAAEVRAPVERPFDRVDSGSRGSSSIELEHLPVVAQRPTEPAPLAPVRGPTSPNGDELAPSVVGQDTTRPPPHAVEIAAPRAAAPRAPGAASDVPALDHPGPFAAQTHAALEPEPVVQPPAAASRPTEPAVAPMPMSIDDRARTPSDEALLRLSHEVSLIDRAWAAMKRNDFARALAELGDYERQFPALGLHPEVLFLRMEAHGRLGQVAAARLEASRILALYPKSAQAGRAQAVIESALSGN